jgi:hypothetical protein
MPNVPPSRFVGVAMACHLEYLDVKSNFVHSRDEFARPRGALRESAPALIAMAILPESPTTESRT